MGPVDEKEDEIMIELMENGIDFDEEDTALFLRKIVGGIKKSSRWCNEGFRCGQECLGQASRTS